MGDRTYVSARIHPLDWHLVYDLFDYDKALSTTKALRGSLKSSNSESTVFGGEYTLEEGAQVILIEEYEANYGWYDEWAEAAARGARFCAYHSYGSDYGPGCHIGLNFKHYPLELTHEGDYFVRMGRDLTPNEQDKNRLEEYLKAETLFEASINRLPTSWEEIIPLCHNKMPNG